MGEEGDGFALAQQWITEGRILRHGARSCGVAERCLELAASYATQRKTSAVPLAERQAVQFMIADIDAELQTTRAVVRQAAAVHEAGGDVRLQSWIAKCQGTEMGFRAADGCMQIHGGMGLTTGLPIEQERSSINMPGKPIVSRMGASTPDRIWVQGRDLCAELLGRISLAEMTWLELTGDLPTPEQARLLDAMLLTLVEHGAADDDRHSPYLFRRARVVAGGGSGRPVRHGLNLCRHS
jgi:Acyl-CoA dehydrogenase, C-terminal domain